MDTSRVNELKTRANTVIEATVEGENSRYRIGQLFYDIVDYDGEQSNAIDALEKKSTKMQEQIEDIAEGGGGGGGTSGRQRTFFYNTSDSAVPELPSVSDYDSTTDTFNHNGQVWKSTNINVQDNEVTWMIWSWFSGDAPQTVDGPVKANPGGGGSNGVDANETEWVYMRTEVKMSPQVYEEWRENLENAKGTDGYGHKDYTQPDIQPTGWTDSPTGIDPDHKYEYASYRTSTIDSTTGKRKWGETGFSAPILWSAYGERGTDGDGVEYIFYADKDGRFNPDPVNYPPNWNESTTGKWKDPEDHSKGRFVFQDNEFIAEGSSWVDEPVDLGAAGYGQGSVQWVSMRKKQNSVWQAYSEPAVWSRLGKDGVVDGYTVDLSNENMPVGTSSDGTVSNWSNSSLVQVFHNSTPMTYDGNAGETPAAGYFNYKIGTITRSDDPDHEASGFKADKNNDTVVVRITTVTGFNEVSATVPITIYLPGGVTRELVITVFGLATGEVGQFIDMAVGSKVIRSNYEGTTVTPSSMKVGVTIGDKTYWSTYGSPEGSAESLGYSFAYGYDEITPEPHAGDIPLSTGHSSLTVNMYKGDYLIDSETIPVIKDGRPGDTGPVGPEGPAARGFSTITYYYKASSTKVAPTITTSDATDPANTNWSEDYPFLYCREWITYTNGDESWQGGSYLDKVWSDSGPKGDKGDKGDTGVSISSVTEYYLATSASTGVTRTGTSGWSTSIPTMTTTEKYLWNYEDVLYSNNTHSYTDAVIIGVHGADGTNGADGRGISSVTEYYLASTANSGITRNSSGWTTTVQTVTASKKYLWNYEKIEYTTGNPSYTDPAIIGVYGDKGDKGDTGAQGAAAVMYDLLPSPSTVKFYVDKSTNTLTPDYISVSCKGVQITGETREDFIQDTSSSVFHSPNGKYQIWYETSNSDGDYSDPAPYIGSGITINAIQSVSIVAINFYLSQGDPTYSYIVKKITVPVDRDGLKGDSGEGSTGQVGKFYFYAGEWETLKANDGWSIKATATEAPYVYVAAEDEYYMFTYPLKDDEDYTIDETNKNPQNDSEHWTKIQYNKFTMADAMFANYAHLGSMIINRDWVISQYGSINGTQSGYATYKNFDPIAFMTKIKGEASIGVITQVGTSASPKPNSQLFKVQRACTINVKGSGTTTLVKLKSQYDNYFRFDNSPELPTDMYDPNIGVTKNVNTSSYTSFTVTSQNLGTYCFLNGNLSDIRVVASSNTLGNVWIPNYAVDLRAGFTYQNNAYVSGTLRANILYHSLTETIIGPSYGDRVLSNDCGDIVVVKINWTSTSSYGDVTLPNPASAEGRLLHVYVGANAQSTSGTAYANILPPSGTIFDYTKGYTVTKIKLIVGDSADFYSDGSTWYLLTAHMRKTD